MINNTIKLQDSQIQKNLFLSRNLKSYGRFLLKGMTALSFVAISYVGISDVNHAHGESLKAELSQSLYNAPDLSARANTVLSKRSALTGARSGFFPTLSVTATRGKQEDSTPSIREAGEGLESYNYSESTLTLKQNIFNGGRDLAGYSEAEIDYQLALTRYSVTLQKHIKEAANAYLSVLLAHEVMGVVEQKLGLIEEQVELEEERFRSGVTERVTVLQAKKRLQAARDESINWQSRYEKSLSEYHKFFAQEPDLENMTDDLTSLLLVPASIDQALEVVKRGHPLYVGASQAADIAEKKIDMARAGYLPTINLVASYDWNYGVDNIQDHTREKKAYVEINWDLFSGFRTKALVEQNAHDWGASLVRIDGATRQIEQLVRSEWAELEKLNQYRQLSEESFALNEEIYQSRIAMRDSGQSTEISVLDARLDMFNAALKQIRYKYEAAISAFKLAEAIGILTPASLGLDAPDPSAIIAPKRGMNDGESQDLLPEADELIDDEAMKEDMPDDEDESSDELA